MPDISMCRGENCTKSANCYRFTAKPSEYWQAYFVTSPVFQRTPDFICEFYWPVEKEPDGL